MDDAARPTTPPRGWLLHAGTVVAVAVSLFSLLEARGTFSATFDEGNHLAAGLEWWQFGSYSIWTENPPLPRAAVAAIPYLTGMRLPPVEDWDMRKRGPDRLWGVSLDLLYGGRGFDANLGHARVGTLPFFLLALGAVWGLADGRRRPGAGMVAVALTATIPALFGHAALATTDIAFAGTFLLALLLLVRWFESATWKRAAASGASLALALLCKFSTLAFFPAAVLAILAARRLAGLPVRPQRDRALPWKALGAHAMLALTVAFVVTWAGYRFSIGRIDDLTSGIKYWLQILPDVSARGPLGSWLLHARLPMPGLFHGLLFLGAHNSLGHEAYLLGQISNHGFWTFYPIALLVKTPLPTLILLALSLPFVARPRPGCWWSVAALLTVLGILLVGLRSHVNLGIRHVFVVLPRAIVAVARIVDERLRIWNGRLRTATMLLVGSLLIAQSTVAVAARRTALGYFNLLAGADPARVLLDSDLDWGQDLYLLRAEAQARGIDTLHIAYFGIARQCLHGLPRLEALAPGRPTRGWIAISENYYRNRGTFPLFRDPCDQGTFIFPGEVPLGSFAWLEEHTPVAIAGTSIRLYHLP